MEKFTMEDNIMKTNYPQILAMRGLVQEHKAHSAWEKGVKLYAFDLLDAYEESVDYQNGAESWHVRTFRRRLLNGAENWSEYSWGGCSLIYNEDIAERLCSVPPHAGRVD